MKKKKDDLKIEFKEVRAVETQRSTLAEYKMKLIWSYVLEKEMV